MIFGIFTASIEMQTFIAWVIFFPSLKKPQSKSIRCCFAMGNGLGSEDDWYITNHSKLKMLVSEVNSVFIFKLWCYVCNALKRYFAFLNDSIQLL